MDRIWQWAWDRYRAKYFWAVFAVSLAVTLTIYLFWSFLIVAVEESSHYVEAAVVTAVAVPVLVYAGTERVAAGHYSQRLPVVQDDDLGALAASFNRMQAGLAERQRLQAAFGTYVDPVLAARPLEQASSNSP